MKSLFLKSKDKSNEMHEVLLEELELVTGGLPSCDAGFSVTKDGNKYSVDEA
jgi:hypothetical protein